MRRVTYISLGLAILLPAALLLSLRYRFAASEGYPTWEAVRNYLEREGEIVIRLPEGLKIVSARCDDINGNVRIDGQTVTTKIGYTWCTISIEIEVDARPEAIYFNPQKLNNWNRMLFVPASPRDPYSAILKFENGVEESHSDVTREFNRQQGGSEQPANRPESKCHS